MEWVCSVFEGQKRGTLHDTRIPMILGSYDATRVPWEEILQEGTTSSSCRVHRSQKSAPERVTCFHLDVDAPHD